MARIEYIPERRPDGTIVLHAVLVGPAERARRALLKLARRAARA